ncbi:MAG: hypothetical protein DRP62_03240, partial [Planctomycetota bacterium]
IQIAKVRSHLLFILDQELAGKVEEFDDGIIIADTYFVKGIERKGDNALIKLEVRNGTENNFYYFGKRTVSEAIVSNEKQKVIVEPKCQCSSFKYIQPSGKNVQVEWLGNWKIKSDMDEITVDYDDSSWFRIEKPISLEEAGLLKHGYVWYRSQFELPGDVSDVELGYTGNATDRQYIYINGSLVFSGITQQDCPQKVCIDNKIITSGRNCIVILYANTFHNKSHPHEGDILKYSGIMTPILINAKTTNGSYSADISSFAVREQLGGILKGYTEMSYDDSDWMNVPAAKKYIMDDELGAIVWFRRKFSYKSKKNIKTAVRLTIPDADQRCVFYLNGKPLGQFESVGPQHKFYVPDTFLEDENILSIILEGPGGYLVNPELDTFYEAIETEIELVFDK